MGEGDDYQDVSIPDFELDLRVDPNRFRTDGTTFLAEELDSASKDMNEINVMNEEFAKYLKMDDETKKRSVSEIELVSRVQENEATKTCTIDKIQDLKETYLDEAGDVK